MTESFVLDPKIFDFAQKRIPSETGRTEQDHFTRRRGEAVVSCCSSLAGRE